jgi:N6-L-threonylcarbamoyladenine synthase
MNAPGNLIVVAKVVHTRQARHANSAIPTSMINFTSNQHSFSNQSQCQFQAISSCMLKPLLRASPRRSLVGRVENARRDLLTLAIESSCDDTSVAILEKTGLQDHGRATLHYHEKVTSNSKEHKGVHPIVALESHEKHLATLVNDALKHLPKTELSSSGTPLQKPMVRRPDFVTVTRGPGMRSNLSTGLNTAKGLAVAWQIPLVAVNHMQAHALTPRLMSALDAQRQENEKLAKSQKLSRRPLVSTEEKLQIQIPYLSLLVSGGHTMLVHTQSLTEHPTLAETVDIAIGDCIDKVGRHVLPKEVLESSESTMYGPILEEFAFPDGPPNYADYTAPASRADEIAPKISKWGWSVTAPLVESRELKYSFVGIDSTVKRIMDKSDHDVLEEERRDLARTAMCVAFEHLASRVVLALETKRPALVSNKITNMVISGGVAANGYLRHIMKAWLQARGYGHFSIITPPIEFCTDNAAMIAWAGIEMFEAGYTSSLQCQALRKWSLDPAAEDGGILGAGWKTPNNVGRRAATS